MRPGSPSGTESAWAYTHLPEKAGLDGSVIAEQAGRVEALVERHAPGFRDSILACQVQAPGDLSGADANLFRGAIGGGTSSIHQQLIFRPLPGLGRSETVVDGLYLAGSCAHPGGGVHGGPGAIATYAALRRARMSGRVRRRALDAAFGAIYR